MTEKHQAIAERDDAITKLPIAIKAAEYEARRDERQRMSLTCDSYKIKNSKLTNKVSELLHRTHQAEIKSREAIRQANKSVKQSGDIQALTESNREEIKQMHGELAAYRIAVLELEEQLDNSALSLSIANAAVPIKTIAKSRDGWGGTSSWPLYVWELIIEQLVNGTPPTAINSNIVTMIKTFSPTTTISELPSIWTIRRARTVLLVVVQTLATYRIAKADKWEQLFTDGTSRRQVAFQDLIISIEEDELFK